MMLGLIELTVETSVPLAAGLIAATALRRRSAAVRHAVLATAVIAACGMPALRVALPAWHFVDVGTRRAAVEPVVPTNGGSTATTTTEFFIPRANTPIAAAAAMENVRLDTLVLASWALGAAIAGVIFILGLARLRWLALRARTVSDGPWHALIGEASAVAGVRRRVELLESEHPWLLATWGWLRPRLFLPKSAAAWPLDRVRIVLLHELAHVARRDWLSQLAAEALRVAFWFNPLAWVAARQLRSESERACDDVVLAAGVEADEFAGELVSLARALRQPRITALPAPAMARPSSLEGRVHAMLNTTLDRRPASRRARVVIAALLFAIALPVASIRAQAFYSLSGRVTDPSNRVLPDATLVLTNQSSGAIYQIKTDAQGQYQFVGLPGSTYSMRVTVMGFETMNVNGLTIGSDTQRDLQLSVGSLEESVTVSASSAPAPPPSADLRATAAERFAARLAKAQAACAADASVGGHLVAPVKLVDAFPIYPDADKAAGIDGTVTMEAVIGEDGFVSDVKNVTGGDALLQRAAEDAVRQWQYSQTLLNCQPTAVHMKVTVNFSAKR